MSISRVPTDPRASGSSAPGADLAEDAVWVQDLVIRYGDLTAVDHASFAARSGHTTVVLGPNGAGKTSTIEHLEGYRRAQAGTSAVLGLDPVRDRRRVRPHIGVMLQNGGIPMSIRPLDALRQYAGFFDDPLDPMEVLERVGLRAQIKSSFRSLSGGQKQRLSLGLALIGRPAVAFLDEPSAGVDLEGRDSISEIISELRDGGACVIVTTHDLNEAERLADRVVIMDRGRVVADGALDELLSGASKDEVHFSSPDRVDVAALGQSLGRPVTEVSVGEYRVDTGGDKTRLMADVALWCADEAVRLSEIRADRLRLDDLFRRLTADNRGAGRSGSTSKSGDPQ